MFDTTAVALATYTASGASGWFDTGDGSQLSGQWAQFIVQNVIGIPNVELYIQTSPDQVSVCDNTIWDGAGSGSPLVNTPGTYTLLFQTRNRYWRFAWKFYANDPGGTSGNSSSSSGQSAISSSSNGGSAAITMLLGLTPNYLS